MCYTEDTGRLIWDEYFVAQIKTDIKSIKNRFLALNRERLKRTQQSLRWKQRDFLDLLPLLFHTNNPLLPGFVSKNTPVGIPDYNPSDKTIEAAKRIEKTFEYKRRAMRSFDIVSIFLMGSTGTVAHSDKSDFDMWLCYNPDLSKGQIASLQKKATAIEQWAEAINLEVHFFLMNAEEFKQGAYVDMSSESSGSAQHHLLLEEFYRTSLLVGGRYPIWWLVPPEYEKDYEEYIADLIKKKKITGNEFIDFGSMGHVPSSEFFGAALWQVYKGIDSPYKSVLKILTMETYAEEYPAIDLLSIRFKKTVYDGETNINALDPYIMLYNKIEEYLLPREEIERLELVRRCFYFKVDLKLSKQDNQRELQWRRDLLDSMIRDWGWNNTMLEILDSRDEWKINRVMKERKILVDELTHSYLSLSDFARKQSSLSQINQSDLNILGRKLYAAFERKAGKVEIVNRGIAQDMIETHLMIEQVTGKNNTEIWQLYHGDDAIGDKTDRTPIKRGHDIIAILAWCHFNKIMNSRTVTAIHGKSSLLNIKELKLINDCFQTHFPDGKTTYTTMEMLSKKPVILSSLMFINVGLNPLNKHGHVDTDIISDKTDVLNYSGFSLNLALSFDIVIESSWQEVLTFSYTGIDGLLKCICQYIDWNATEDDLFVAPPIPHAYSFSSSRGDSIAKRIEELFYSIINYFSKPENQTESRFIFEVEKTFYIIQNNKGKLSYNVYNNPALLNVKLAEPLKNFTPTEIDNYTLRDTLLPVIFSANRPDVVQFFYRINGDKFEVYIIDENGSLFTQVMPFYNDEALLHQFDLFFDAITNRQKQNASNGGALADTNRLYFKILKNRTGKIGMEQSSINKETANNSYFNVQVIGNIEENQTNFTIYCNEKEFSTYEHGAELFRSVAKHVLELRQSGQRYPIYITDIDLSPALLNGSTPNKLQTINFLTYKKRIEEKLNSELSKL